MLDDREVFCETRSSFTLSSYSISLLDGISDDPRGFRIARGGGWDGWSVSGRQDATDSWSDTRAGCHDIYLCLQGPGTTWV